MLVITSTKSHSNPSIDWTVRRAVVVNTIEMPHGNAIAINTDSSMSLVISRWTITDDLSVEMFIRLYEDLVDLTVNGTFRKSIGEIEDRAAYLVECDDRDLPISRWVND